MSLVLRREQHMLSLRIVDGKQARITHILPACPICPPDPSSGHPVIERRKSDEQRIEADDR